MSEDKTLVERLRSNRPIPTLPHEAADHIEGLQGALSEANTERMEQARLLGMSAERELALRAEVAEARELVRVATETTQKHLRGLCDAEDRAVEARQQTVADVAAWLADSAIKDADDLRRLHADKRLTPMMTKEWEILIQTKVGIATALETGEWKK